MQDYRQHLLKRSSVQATLFFYTFHAESDPMFRRFAEKVVSSMFLQKVFCISLLFMTITAAVGIPYIS
jgi:hypothetical protein